MISWKRTTTAIIVLGFLCLIGIFHYLDLKASLEIQADRIDGFSWKESLTNSRLDQIQNKLDRIRTWDKKIKGRFEAFEKERIAVAGKPNEPNESSFADQIQESIKGVVHLRCQRWQGSGFVISPNLIVTARHCVEGVDRFDITTYDGHHLYATRAFESEKYDAAFIWIDDLTCQTEKREEIECKKVKHKVKLHPLKLGKIKDCVLGQPVYTIGSPYGKVNFNSFTTGVISGVDRDWSHVGEEYGWKVAFTIDAAGHPGNSGCPVFTMDGKVRGILVAGYSPVLIGVVPCDTFLSDLAAIELKFIQDKYKKVEPDQYDPYSRNWDWRKDGL